MTKCKTCNEEIVETNNPVYELVSGYCYNHRPSANLQIPKNIIDRLENDPKYSVKKEGDSWLVRKSGKVIATSKTLIDAVCTKNYYSSLDFGGKLENK